MPTGHLVKVFHEENPENIKWKDLQVDYVIDASGMFTEKETAEVNNAPVRILSGVDRATWINNQTKNKTYFSFTINKFFFGFLIRQQSRAQTIR